MGFFDNYKFKTKNVEEKVVVEEPKEKDLTVKPNIINRYVNEALGIIPDSTNDISSNSIYSRSSISSIPNTNTQKTPSPVNEEITRKIQEQLDPLRKSPLQKTQAPTQEIKRKNPLDKVHIEKREEPGLSNVEYEDHPNKRFMKEFSRHELKNKDHSGLIVAKKCLREYFYKEVINVVPAGEKNIFYPWGTAYHIFRQRLSEYYGYGENEPKNYDSEKAKEAFKKAAREGTEYWMKHGEDQKPDTKYDWYTAERLYSSFKIAFEHWVLERKQGRIKVIAVEQYFNMQLVDGKFVQGRIDEAVIYNNDLWGRDFKTTQKPKDWFEKSLKPNNQVRTYSHGNATLAGRECRGLIIQSMYNAKSTKKEQKGPDVYELMIEVTKDELVQWEIEQTHWNKILEFCRDNDTWPQSEVNCSYCDYQPVCSKPTEAAMVYTLQNKYVKHLRNPAHVGE